MALRIIIAGGGITGLTLANMLQQFDIDFLVLEAHAAIAPPVGASIGLFPNGLRILDQLGCYAPILKLSLQDQDIAYTRNKHAQILSTLPAMSQHLERRHGYGLHFFDRQTLLQILYDNIRHKDRVRLEQKVTDIDFTDSGVTVRTINGGVFTGTLVVGADGIHSAVRRLMRAQAAQLQPGYFPVDEEDHVPCHYICSFGIAQHVPGWVAGEQNIVTGNGRSQLVVSGPDNRVYWFLFERLPETKYGKNIPRFTLEDEAKFVQRNADLLITPKVTFGAVFNQKLSSTLTPLHEIVYQKWYFRRIIIMGDSAHKSNPIGGQGANGAMESCAEFVNALLRHIPNTHPDKDPLTDDDIAEIFTETQRARHDRAAQIVAVAHQRQAISAYENPLVSTVLEEIVQPLVGNEFPLSLIGRSLAGGSRVHRLPVPRRRRAVPFTDELPATPITPTTTSCIRYGFIGSMVLMLYFTGKPFSQTSIPSSGQLETIVSGLSLLSPLLVYTIEGYRLGNRGTPLALPSLFAVGIQRQGIGRIAPLHALFAAIFATHDTTGRAVSPHVVASLLPALALGYLLPAAIRVAAPTSIPQMGAVWRQFAPPLVSLLTGVFAAGWRRWLQQRQRQQRNENEKKEKDNEEFARYEKRDLAPLNTVYACAFALQAVVHIATLAYAVWQPDISIWPTLGLPSSFQTDWNISGPSDQVAAWAATVAGNLYSVWDLRRRGYITTRRAVAAAAGVVVGQGVVGPGATWAALWWWREETIAGLAD